MKKFGGVFLSVRTYGLMKKSGLGKFVSLVKMVNNLGLCKVGMP